jgi:vacuolar-type H+-ATPase subunit B/Vma2
MATETPAKEMTKGDAAKRVRRTVTEYVDGKDGAKVPRTARVAIDAKEVLAFKDHGTHVVVVTTDGQKFSDATAE